jgi:hypothetical protein
MTAPVMNKQTAERFRAAGFTVVTQPTWNTEVEDLVSGPDSAMENMPSRWVGMHHPHIKVDRFSLTPGGDFVRQLLPGGKFVGPEPQMFSSGPLPAFTASGVEPSVLRRCRWSLRHSMAYTPSRAAALAMIEEGDDLEDRLQTDIGAGALQDYFLRCREWAITPPARELSLEDLQQVFPSWQDD